MKRYTRKQLKRPDEFLSLSMRGWSFIQSHASRVGVTVVAGVAVLAIVWTWSHYADKRGSEATAALTRAVDIYNQTVVPSTQKLPADEDGVPRFSTRVAKLKAAEEALTKLVDKGGALGAQSLALRAGVRLDQGKFGEAIGDYKKVLDRISDPALRARILEDLGYCHEGLKEWDKALEYFRKLPRDGDGKYVAMYQEARILSKKGQVKEAVRLLQEIVGKSAPGGIQDRASDQLALLEDK